MNSLGRQRKTLLEPTQAVKALLNAARPFLRKHHDDTQLNILVLCADVTVGVRVSGASARAGAAGTHSCCCVLGCGRD